MKWVHLTNWVEKTAVAMEADSVRVKCWVGEKVVATEAGSSIAMEIGSAAAMETDSAVAMETDSESQSSRILHQKPCR